MTKIKYTVCQRCGKALKGRQTTYCCVACRDVGASKAPLFTYCQHTNCGVPLTKEQRNNKYCGGTCYDAMQTKPIEEKICARPNCTTAFSKQQIWNGVTYCSPECYRADTKQSHTVTYCISADCTNERTRDQAKYCSPKCRSKGHRRQMDAAYCASPNCENPLSKDQVMRGTIYCGRRCGRHTSVKEYPEADCANPDCTKPLRRDQVQVGNIYCSNSCRTNASRSANYGKRVRYPTIWNNELRKAIRARDNHVCQECGNKQTDTNLSVHHINYIKEDCASTNLISLCASCHMKTNGRRDYWEPHLQNKIAKN